jgi:hypothetical protein
MSVELPVVAIVFGSVTPPQKDVLELTVHLGQTNEVSSFNCLLQNFDGKYSPGSSNEIVEGVDGSISIGRGASCPLIATVRVEDVEYVSSVENNRILHLVRVKGRCWGERLFRRVVTKTYENMKGEAIVKDLIDNYVGLSHVRNGTELIENTDTTYTRLEYENTPVFDVLKYIASSADKAGVIGFDFRVAPDGKFEFFPRNTKSSPVSLKERIEFSQYSKDIHRVRNRIWVFGAAEKKYPSDGDAWTETLDLNGDAINDWQSGTGTGSVSLANDRVAKGTYSIKHTTNTADYYGRLRLIIPSGMQPNLNKYPSIQFQINREGGFSNAATLILQDNAGNWATREFSIPEADKWALIEFNAGKKHENEWNWVDAGFNWEIINEIFWDVHFPGTGTGNFWVDNLFFNRARWEAMQEDTSSQSNYGLRELVEVDEELHSDNECLLRAKALLAHLKDPVEHLTIRSTVIDYGTTPLLPADKIHVTLPNENIDADFRIISVEYHVRANEQVLEITLELGREPPLLADYLYALKKKTESLARYKAGIIA